MRPAQTVGGFLCSASKSGKKSGDIQPNSAEPVAADLRADGAAIRILPFAPKAARDVDFL
jgi:hypothetical protein